MPLYFLVKSIQPATFSENSSHGPAWEAWASRGRSGQELDSYSRSQCRMRNDGLWKAWRLVGEWRKYCTSRKLLAHKSGNMVRLVVQFDNALPNWRYSLASKVIGDYFSDLETVKRMARA
ncbi:hypothetical protein MMC31_002559, partial [Peltigera leucophlebia]|nr:hypothetical protein [Peltigera leucophlebia]